jgi:arsenate reductase
MKKVLFVCIHNSARSQMAEAFLNVYGKGQFMAESAGIESGTLNPLVVKAMQGAGIDISGNKAKRASDLLQQGKEYDAVITVCDAANADRCPVFPGKVKKIAWWFDDPSTFTGTEEEKIEKIKVVMEQVKEKVQQFIKEAMQPAYWL